MSYARWSAGSDIYVFASRQGVTCCGCILLGAESSFHAASTAEIVSHVEEHIKAGHDVPERVVTALIADDAQNFPPAPE